MTLRIADFGFRIDSSFVNNPQSTIRNPQSVVGFTLIEVMLVAATLGILLVWSAPRFQQTWERFRIEGTAVELTQLLRYAHERAVSQGDIIAWSWDRSARRATLQSFERQDPSQPLPECAEGQSPLSPPLQSAPVPDGVSVAVARAEQAVDCIRFFPDGTSEPATLHVIQGRRDYTITVDGPTSRISLSAGVAAR